MATKEEDVESQTGKEAEPSEAKDVIAEEVDPASVQGALAEEIEEKGLTPREPRERKLTEKGMAYRSELKMTLMKRSFARRHKIAEGLKELIIACEDKVALRRERYALCFAMEALEKAFKEYTQLEPEDKIAESEFVKAVNESKQLIASVEECLFEIKAETRSRISQMSRLSKRSTDSQFAKKEAAAKAKELEIKLKFIETETKMKEDQARRHAQIQADQAKREAERQAEQAKRESILQAERATEEARMQAELERLQVQRDLTIAKARMETFSDKDDVEDDDDSVARLPPDLQLPVDNELTERYVMSQEPNSDPVPQPYVDFAQVLQQQCFNSRLPPPEPSVFNGDPLKFQGWMTSFELLIESRQISPAERLHYLQRYLSDSVKESVEGFFYFGSDNAYHDAKALLKQRYGDPFNVANAFRKKLKEWPKVSGNDGKALLRMSDFLRQCDACMKMNSYLNVLNDCNENHLILKKLPDWLVVRWSRIVMEWKDTHQTFPPFTEFVSFMSKEAKIASDPVTSLQSLKDIPTNRAECAKPRKSSSFVADVKEKKELTDTTDDNKEDNATDSSEKPKRTPCILCQGDHHVNWCKEFNAKSMEDKRKFITDNKLCFSCLRLKHFSKDCKKKLECKKCGKLHPTSLHDDNFVPKSKSTEPQPENAVSSATHFNNPDLTRKATMIVPVLVSHKSEPDNERLVYALLDTQSDTSFILESTKDALGLEGKKTQLCLSTMSEENKTIESEMINGLIVRSAMGGRDIELPTVYTRPIVPVNRDHIPTLETATKWPHLKSIAHHFMISRDDCEVGLLIGYDCPLALYPITTMYPEKQGPFALRTHLGWTLVGPVDAKRNPSVVAIVNDIERCKGTIDEVLPISKDSKRNKESNFIDQPSNQANSIIETQHRENVQTTNVQLKNVSTKVTVTAQTVFDTESKETRTSTFNVEQERRNFTERFRHITDWYRLKRTVAMCLKLKQRLLDKVRQRQNVDNDIQRKRDESVREALMAADLQTAEREIFKQVQKEAFEKQFKAFERSSKLTKRVFDKDKRFYFVDPNGLIRESSSKRVDLVIFEYHPLILPESHYITKIFENRSEPRSKYFTYHFK